MGRLAKGVTLAYDGDLVYVQCVDLHLMKSRTLCIPLNQSAFICLRSSSVEDESTKTTFICLHLNQSACFQAAYQRYASVHNQMTAERVNKPICTP